MLKEFLDAILKMQPPTLSTQNGITYTDKTMTAIVDPIQPCESVSTLQGFADLVGSKKLNQAHRTQFPGYVIVDDHRTVQLLDFEMDTWGRRNKHVQADLESDLKGFPYEHFMGVETFVIALMSLFEATPDRDAIVKLVSKITEEDIRISEDDGISQSVTVKSSTALKTTETVKRIVTLAPYRTFREVPQPQSQFVFRVRKTEQGPTCALFEADGGRWRLDAVANIKAWLQAKLPNDTIIA